MATNDLFKQIQRDLELNIGGDLDDEERRYRRDDDERGDDDDDD